MKCHLIDNNSPYVLLGPFTAERRQNDPFRLVIHNFLSEFEIDLLRTRMKEKLSFERSRPLLVSPLNAQFYSDAPKASTVGFDNMFYNNQNFTDHQHEVKLDNNINQFADIIQHPQNMMYNIAKRILYSVYLNVIDYGSAAQYRMTMHGLAALVEAHDDSYIVGDAKETLHENFEYRHVYGDIMATMLIWLSDTQGGGGTYFSGFGREDVFAPKKGAALFWININSNGNNSPLQQHGGCPVSKGVKIVLGQWINHYNQWKNFPCKMSENLKPSLSFIDNSPN